MTQARPGLIILDMSNDDWRYISSNEPHTLSNIEHLANSDSFQLIVDSKKPSPQFKVLSNGPKLVNCLQKLSHLQHYPKKGESALQGTLVLQALENSGISHVCVCGTGTDTAVVATAKDLVAHGFHIFVMKDATASKNGPDAHEMALEEIACQFGPDVVVSVDDLLGDGDEVEASVEETPEVETKSVLSSLDFANSVNESTKKPLCEMTEAERAEEMRKRDAAKIAARKKMFDAARFAHIENANAKAKEQEEIFKKRIEEKKIPGAKYTPRPTATPAEANKNRVQSPKDTRKGWKLVYKKKEPPVVKVEPTKPFPPLAGKNERPTNVRQSVNPGWAAVDKQNERPHKYVHSSVMDCHGLAHAAPSPVNPTGQKFIPHDEPTYKKVEYGSQGKKPQLEGVNVIDSISSIQGSGPKPTLCGPRSMAKAKVKESKSESFDAEGNVIRTITRHITEPDGKKRTETEVIKIPK